MNKAKKLAKFTLKKNFDEFITESIKNANNYNEFAKMYYILSSRLPEDSLMHHCLEQYNVGLRLTDEIKLECKFPDFYSGANYIIDPMEFGFQDNRNTNSLISEFQYQVGSKFFEIMKFPYRLDGKFFPLFQWYKDTKKYIPEIPDDEICDFNEKRDKTISKISDIMSEHSFIIIFDKDLISYFEKKNLGKRAKNKLILDPIELNITDDQHYYERIRVFLNNMHAIFDNDDIADDKVLFDQIDRNKVSLWYYDKPIPEYKK